MNILNLHQRVWTVKWNKKRESFKYSISVGGVIF